MMMFVRIVDPPLLCMHFDNYAHSSRNRRTSRVPVNKRLTELARLRQVGGTDRESVVLEAFKELVRFNTCRLADLKDQAINRLARVTTVCVETMRIVKAMRRVPRQLAPRPPPMSSASPLRPYAISSARS